ncbi:MAG: urease accessory protein UreE [Lysobacter sp.]
MLICSEVYSAGAWDPAVAADTVVLDFDGRHRRRVAMTGQAGLAFLLDLPRATALRNGDGLLLGDGRIVGVVAAPERLIGISAPDLSALVRIAWHLGNRHLPTQVSDGQLYIRYDHVILEMVKGLQGVVTELQAPFDPEGGAFSVLPDAAGHAGGQAHRHPHEHTGESGHGHAGHGH